MHLRSSWQRMKLQKTAIVDLIEVRLARGMCGKSYLMLTGEVAAVEAAIDRAKEQYLTMVCIWILQ